MRIIVIFIGLAIVVVTALWLIGAGVGSVGSAVEQTMDNGDDGELPGTFDTPGIFSTSEEQGGQDLDNSGAPQSQEQPQQQDQPRQQSQQGEPQSPTEAEIQRLEEERRLIEAQQKLEEQKAESMPPIIPEKLPKPVTKF